MLEKRIGVERYLRGSQVSEMTGKPCAKIRCIHQQGTGLARGSALAASPSPLWHRGHHPENQQPATKMPENQQQPATAPSEHQQPIRAELQALNLQEGLQRVQLVRTGPWRAGPYDQCFLTYTDVSVSSAGTINNRIFCSTYPVFAQLAEPRRPAKESSLRVC